MQRTTRTLALLLALAALTVPVVAEDPFGPIPQLFYGGLMDADGTAAPVGTIVVASVRGQNVGSITATTAGEYGDAADGAYKLAVWNNVLVTGDPITFYIDGVRAAETATFAAGTVTHLNLTASAPLPKERPKESTTEPVSPKAGQNTTVTGTATGTSVTLTTTVDLTDETVSFTAFEVPPDDQPVPSSLAPVGRYAEITSTITNDQIESVMIRIFYTDAAVAAAGIDEAQIRVYWWNQAGGVWEQLPGGVDTVRNVAWGETNHFSTFALLSVTATPVTPTPGGGGGGGGGHGGGAGPIGTPTPTPVPYEREGVVPTDSTGALTESIAITAADGIAVLTVPMGVVACDSSGDPLTTISIDPVPISEMPAAPPGATFAFMETAYDCLPDGATFSTAIPLRFTIAEEDWTTMVAADLTPVVRWWNKETGGWEEVSATVNQGTRTVTARIKHFSVYALLFTESAEAAPTTAATSVPTTAPAETAAEELPMLAVLIAVVAVIAVASAAFFLMKR